jgi:alpha-galactosidase
MKEPLFQNFYWVLRLALVVFFFSAITRGFATAVWLDQLDLSKTAQDWGDPHQNTSVTGQGLSIGGQKFSHGLGTHANSTLIVDLKGGAKTFSGSVGVDNDINGAASGGIEFFLYGDGKLLWRSGVMRAGGAAKNFELNLEGVRTLILKVGAASADISYDHADWANAKFEVADGAELQTIFAPPEPEVILTPAAPRSPRINGASIFGVRPGHPFLFQIPATGDRPMKFFANDLPDGLALDAATGLITGIAPAKAGDYHVTLRAENALGAARKEFKIVVGNQIALTPPMGWNSWNCFAHAVDDSKIRSAANAMVTNGLIEHGWTYINIDDCWEGGRDATGNILANEKFPDMKALADYVHSQGLRIGIYSSPGPKTCGGFTGSWQHELQDAQQYAAWGFDYLKYDWCSYSQVQDHSLPERERLMKPYQIMRQSLDRVDRDIVFSLCQYGMGNVWEWGTQVGGNCWRTTGDISDSWGSMTGNGFGSAGREPYAGPGHWNDPDMLVVGKLGWGHLRPTRLTPNEQYTHISLWCLLSSPLLIGCDMSQLDAFTLNLLSNDEVLAVDQDPLGEQASRISQNGNLEIWAKKMEDGSWAVGLFNRGELESPVELAWSELGITGTHRVRDLWRQSDLGEFSGSFHASVPRHGVVLVRIW